MNTPNEPSSGDATLGNHIDLPDGRRARACWFPSMGGYAGRALIVAPQRDGDCCTEVWVWHDGAFPFSSEPSDHSRWPGEEMRSPVRLTIHGGQDFIAFGQLVDECEAVADPDEEQAGA